MTIMRLLPMSVLSLLASISMIPGGISRSSIQNEGDACFDMAAAMPGLQNFTGDYFLLHFSFYSDEVFNYFTKTLIACTSTRVAR